MKHELFFAILSTILSPLPDDTRVYHKHTWKDNWVNVSRERIGLHYMTNTKLFLSTNGTENGLEKITLRIDRHGVKMISYQNVFTDYIVDVDCMKKQAIYTQVLHRNSTQEVTSTIELEDTEPQKFDDSHLFGAACAARALNDVLGNQEVKSIDSCDFRQQLNGNNPVQLKNSSYTFPIRWDVETCKALRSSIWLYSVGQDEAARVRLAWTPSLAILVENFYM